MSAVNDTPDIMNVRQIIELAFGDFEGNTVNFKLVQTVLFLLARQMRLLERRVDVELGPVAVRPSDTTLSVTEVKIHAMQKKIAKKKYDKDKSAGPGGTKPSADVDAAAGAGAGVGRKGKKTGRTSTDKSSSDKTSTDKASSEKSSTYKTSSSDKTSTDKTTSSDKTSTDKTSSGKTTSSDKTSTDKTSSGKTTSSDKTSTDKTSGGKTTSSDKTSSDKPSSSKTTSSSKDKSSSKSSSGKSGEKTAPSQKKPDTYHDILNTLEEQREKVLRVIHQRADSFEETNKLPTPMASVGSMEAQYEKILVVERVPSTEAKVGESVQGQKRTPQISVVTQDQFEQMAEAVRQLQSKFLPVGTPGFPEHAELMEELRRGASLTDAMAALQLSARLEATEKALAQMIAMVTELARQTPGVELDSETQALFEAPGVPFNTAATWQKDFTDSVVGTLGAPSSAPSSTPRGGGASEGGRGPPDSGRGLPESGRSAKSGSKGRDSTATPSVKSQDTSRKTTSGKPQDHTTTTQATLTTSEKSVGSIEMTSIPQTSNAPEATSDEFVIKPDYITYEDLDVASKKLQEDLINTVTAITTRTSNNAEQAYKLALNLDTKVEAVLTSASRMGNLEKLVKQYADQINALDTGLSSQMTNYQEQITQMQHDLEIGLETMAEVLGNTGGDTVAVTELNSHFTSLQVEFENMLFRQRDLRDAQNIIAFDLENLWKEIEMLRDTKSDREEVADALRDKAGIGELNGLVSLQQFDAVRGDFEKRIGAAYDKFNNQEIIWQKAIDDLERELNEKADLLQVESLRNEINKYLNIMKDRMQVIIDIVGEPKSAMLSKKLFRDTACLSCGNPAHMDKEAPVCVPALPKFHSARQPAEGAEAETTSKGGGDYGICYPDFPIPHPRDPRSHVCQRYCGGSHTVLTAEGPNRAPPGIVVQQALRPVSTEPGTDGKMYLVDQHIEKIPCLACNIPKPTPAASEP